MNVMLCTGVMRSGSTWAYNVLRILSHIAANARGMEEVWGYLDREKLEETLQQHIDHPGVVAVYKSHYTYPMTRVFIREGRAKNVCTIRDPRDCVASRQKFKPQEDLGQSTALVKGSFQDAMGYEDHTLLVLYDQIMENPAAQVKRISEYVLLRLADSMYADIAAETDMEKMRQLADALPEAGHAVQAHGALVDTVTSLHTNHIDTGEVGRYKRDFTSDQAHQVSAALKEEIQWFKSKKKQLRRRQ